MGYKYKIVSETEKYWFIEFDYFKEKELKPLKLKKTVGPHKDITRKKELLWKIVDFKLKPQNNYLEKIFVIELLENVQDKHREVRIGYYIIGKHGRLKERWSWGQYCPFIPLEDLKELYTLIKDYI